MNKMLVPKAIEFSAKKHNGQIRKFSQLPYIVHPFTVMYLIQKYKGTSKNIENLMCAALLHDTLEDTECSFNELETEFNYMVASIVLELTSDKTQIDKLGKNEYMKIKCLNLTKYAFILKLLDRLANVSDSPYIGYVKDTIKLMNHLIVNRKGLTSTQITIINNILEVCEEFKLNFKK